jgi:hypothetical protein
MAVPARVVRRLAYALDLGQSDLYNLEHSCEGHIFASAFSCFLGSARPLSLVSCESRLGRPLQVDLFVARLA